MKGRFEVARTVNMGAELAGKWGKGGKCGAIVPGDLLWPFLGQFMGLFMS